MGRANGEGSVWRRADGRYGAAVQVWTTDGQKRLTTTKKRRKDADAWLTQMKSGRLSGAVVNLDGERVRMAEYLSEWLENAARPTIAASTYDRYRVAVHSQLIPQYGGTKIADLTPAQLRAGVQGMVRAGYADATVRHVYGVLRTALKAAVDDDLIPKTPFRNVKLPQYRPKMRALSEDEARALLGVAASTRREALYALALRSGMREGELSALMWKDVDLVRGEIAVSRSVDTHRKGNGWGTTKTGERRTIELHASTVAKLEAHRKITAAERLRSRIWEPPQEGELVFPNRRGRVTRRTSLMRDFHRDLQSAGLPHIRFHDLRHTAASLMLRAGEPVHVVAQILGHKDPAMTLRRYSHVLSGQQAQAAAKMADILP